MSKLAYTREAVNQATADLREARTTLTREKGELDGEVRALLGSGWTGVAADSFRTGWDDWCVGLGDVEDGLEAMAQLIDAFLVDMTEKDEQSQASLDAVAAKIVARLGG